MFFKLNQRPLVVVKPVSPKVVLVEYCLYGILDEKPVPCSSSFGRLILNKGRQVLFV